MTTRAADKFKTNREVLGYMKSKLTPGKDVGAVEMKALMACGAPFVMSAGEIKFYEHPILGNDCGLLAVYEGRMYQTKWRSPLRG